MKGIKAISLTFLVLNCAFVFVDLLCSTGNLELAENMADLMCEIPANISSTMKREIGQCNSDLVQAGTIVHYKCARNYVTLDMEYSKNVITCLENGDWVNIERFQNYYCNIPCGQVKCPEPQFPNCHTVEGSSNVICNGRATYYGDKTHPGLWPWHASIFRYGPSTNENPHYICGGTLIRSGVILTAAHCIADLKNNIPFPVNEFKVIIGALSGYYNESIEPESFDSNGKKQHFLFYDDVQIHNVTEIRIPDTFEGSSLQSDIAILRLDSDTYFGGCASPICLPYDENEEFGLIRPEQVGTVVGFGVDEIGEITHNLRAVTLPIVSTQECSGHFKKVHSPNQFCAGSDLPRAQSVCNGDSGGGFFVGELPSDAVADSPVTIHGIVSFNRKGCADMAVYTRVFPFLPWINRIVRNFEAFNSTIIYNTKNNTRKTTRLNVLTSAKASSVYKFEGTQESPKKFTLISLSVRSRISELQLNRMEVDMSALVSSLNGCDNLERIIMTSINITNINWNQAEKIYLPKLKSYKLHLVNINNLSPTKASKEINFTKLLFFHRYDGNFLPDPIDIDIKYINTKGLPLPSLLLETKDVNDGYGIYKASYMEIKNSLAADKVLKAANQYKHFHQFRQLRIFNSSLKITEVINFLSDIKYIKFHQVRLVNPTEKLIKKFLRAFTSVVHLELDFINTNKIFVTSLLRSNWLEKLTVSSGVISAEENIPFEFLGLKKLTLINCMLEEQLLSVPSFWALLEEVFISLKPTDVQTINQAYIHYRILHKLLNSPKMHEIFMGNFQRLVISGGTYLPGNISSIICEVETELSNMGYNKNDASINIQRQSPNSTWQFFKSQIYRLEGTADKPIPFVSTGFPIEVRTKITELHLCHVEISPRVLMNTLRGWINLQYLNITHVNWVGTVREMQDAKKVYLPSVVNLTCKPNYNDSADEDFDILETCLFFKTELKQLDLSNLQKYGINFDIGRFSTHLDAIVVYNTIFKLNNKEYIYDNTKYENSIKFPYNTPTTLKEFKPESVQFPAAVGYLTMGELNVKRFKNSTKALKHLELERTNLIDGNLNDILSVAPELEVLSFMGNWWKDIFDITALANPLNLREINLATVTFNQTIVGKPNVLPNLHKVILSSVIIDENILNNFNQSFPNIQSLKLVTTENKFWISTIRLFNKLIQAPEEYNELVNLEFFQMYSWLDSEIGFDIQEYELFEKLLEQYGISDYYGKELQFSKDVGGKAWKLIGSGNNLKPLLIKCNGRRPLCLFSNKYI